MVKEKKEETDDLLDFMINRQKKAGAAVKGCSGSLTFMAKDSELFWTGVELPSLALRWLFDSNVLPLGHIIGFAGPPQSQKSSLALEMSRWILGQKGYVSYIDCEGGKVSSSLIESIIPPELIKRMPLTCCPTIDSAQKQITTIIEGLKTYGADKGVKPLYGILIDSLTGAPTEGYSKRVDKSGHDEPTWGDMAKSWTGYLRKLSGELIGKPVVFMLVNHVKDKPATVPGMAPKKTTPGGVEQEYASSIYLWIKRLSMDQDTKKEVLREEALLKGGGIRRLQLETRKSSMGTEGRRIHVDFMWFYDDKQKQQSLFNWAAADGAFLSEHQKDYGVAEVCEVKCFDGKYTCPRLNLVKVSAEELGRAAINDAKLVAELQTMMHVKIHKVYDGSWESFNG